MIVPNYWAEAKERLDSEAGQRTIRRFGWSNESEVLALQHAQSRVDEAITQLRSGESVLIREPKVAYNGADGLPIREEVIARQITHDQSELVLTRNSYGAICLNTPNVLFADVDVRSDWGCWIYVFSWVMIFAALLTLAIRSEIENPLFMVMFVSMLLAAIVGSVVHWVADRFQGTPRQQARRRIEAFSRKHADWVLRLYETPNGWRVLVMHDVFDPRGDQARDFFKRIGSDPVYVRMCFNQNCFRARVTPKPWRIGMVDPMRPRPGVWPINPERLPERLAWICKYDQVRVGYSACRYVTTLGALVASRRCREAEVVRQVHDQWCEIDRNLPTA